MSQAGAAPSSSKSSKAELAMDSSSKRETGEAMRGRYLFSRYLGECFRPLTLVVAIGTFATGSAARAQGVSDHSISALPVPEGPGDSTPTADHVRTTTEPPRF